MLTDMELLLLLFLLRALIYGQYIVVRSWLKWIALRFQWLSSGLTYLQATVMIMIGCRILVKIQLCRLNLILKAYSYLTIELTQVLTLQEADNIVFGPS